MPPRSPPTVRSSLLCFLPALSSLGGIALPPAGTTGDLDALLLSAFSPAGTRTASLRSLSTPTDLPAEPSPAESSLDVSPAGPILAAFPAEIANDVSPAGTLLSPSPAGIVNDLTSAGITNDVSPAENTNDTSPAGTTADVSPAEVSSSPASIPAGEGRMRVLEVSSGSPRDWLGAWGSDVVGVARSGSFALLVTLRGTVESLARGAACSAASGVSSLSAALRRRPRLVPSLGVERALRGRRVRQAATTGRASFALARSGELYCWGEGPAGELGLGAARAAAQAELVVRLLPRGVRKVACGAAHVLAVDAGGAVFAWGENRHGELGLGDTRARSEPQRVGALKRTFVVDVAAGDGFSLALDARGRVFAMGRNDLVSTFPRSHAQGQCAAAAARELLLPAQVRQFPGPAVSLACGAAHVVALARSGAVVAWGCGAHGELAIPAAVAYAASPQVVPLAGRLCGGETVRFVRADMHGSVAVTSRNRVFQWGNGELAPPREIFALPAGEGAIVDVAAGVAPIVLIDTAAGIPGVPAISEILETADLDDFAGIEGVSNVSNASGTAGASGASGTAGNAEISEASEASKSSKSSTPAGISDPSPASTRSSRPARSISAGSSEAGSLAGAASRAASLEWWVRGGRFTAGWCSSGSFCGRGRISCSCVRGRRCGSRRRC